MILSIIDKKILAPPVGISLKLHPTVLNYNTVHYHCIKRVQKSFWELWFVLELILLLYLVPPLQKGPRVRTSCIIL